MNFIRGYMKLCERSEIPEIFALWSAIGGVSALLGRRVVLDMGVFRVFPNMYIVFTAGSAARKSVPIVLMRSMLLNLEPPPMILSQKITPEGLIAALSGVEPELVTKTGGLVKPTRDAVGFIIADELQVFLSKHSYEQGLAGMLIPLYDCDSNFSYTTRSRGKELLTNCCLGLLGASTIDWIRDIIPPQAVGGGLTSRMIFVHHDAFPPSVPFPEIDLELMDQLQQQMLRISTIEGKFHFDDGGRKVYAVEYDRFRTTTTFYRNKNLAGYAGRRNVHLLKLAMVLACADEAPRLITANYMQTAIWLLEQVEAHLTHTMDLIVASEGGTLTGSVEEFILKTPTGTTRTDVMTRFQSKLSSRELSEIIDTLVHGGKIEVRSVGGTIVYTPTTGPKPAGEQFKDRIEDIKDLLR